MKNLIEFFFPRGLKNFVACLYPTFNKVSILWEGFCKCSAEKMITSWTLMYRGGQYILSALHIHLLRFIVKKQQHILKLLVVENAL